MLNSFLAAAAAAVIGFSGEAVTQEKDGSLRAARGTYIYEVSVTSPDGAYSADACNVFAFNLATMPSPAPFLAGGVIKSAKARTTDDGVCVAIIAVER